MKRWRLGRVGIAIVGVLLIAGASPVAARVEAFGPAPKVVLIVGPVGDVTPFYRRLADEAAAAALKLTPNVVKVYSPDATWERVKAELQGASIVVYLGHGNGWPSIYHDRLFPSTENGFGLNPHAGAAGAHQYFGETQIGNEIKLAKNALVVFSHLCYASGNTEPGLAEGTLAQAQQRVDNYAAGFFRAGAGAVIADAYLSPAYYVTSALKGHRSIDTIWRNAPSRNDHFLTFPSVRTDGAIAEMDPDQVSSGFHRSIVLTPRLTSRQVVVGAPAPPVEVAPMPEPTLASLGVTFGAPDLSTPPTAGSSTRLVLPIARDVIDQLPDELLVGTRWDRLDGAAADDSSGASTSSSASVPATNQPAATIQPAASTRPAVVTQPATSPRPTASVGVRPSHTSTSTPSQSPSSTAASPNPSGQQTAAQPSSSASTSPAASPSPSAAPVVAAPVPTPLPDLVAPEVPGEVVAPVPARRIAAGLSVPVKVPTKAGLYRLVATLHRPDGLAYDASTQALVPALVVRVTGPRTAVYSVPATASATAGRPFELVVDVSNLGRSAWGHAASMPAVGEAELVPASRASLVARWVSLGAGAPGDAATTAVLPAGLPPGETATVQFNLTAPTSPGEYLVVLDVLDPGVGSFAALGVPPGIVRVTVSS